MINYLRHMAVFGIVVEKGTFRAAAQHLNLAPSRVSQTISDLEEHLGTTLFYRNTRKLSLTSEGEHFYKHIADMMASVESGLNELNSQSQQPVGSLKISLPAFLEHSIFSSNIAHFIHDHPLVSVALNYTDQRVDMLQEGLDLRIRAKADGIEESTMVSHKLGEIKRVLVSSPRYYEQQLEPKHPLDLKDWDWIHFQMRSNTIEFISPSNETINIAGHSRLSVNSANALLYFVNQHSGISILPENLISDHLKQGKLVHVLPQWQVAPLECYAVWPDRSRRESLTTLLLQYLSEGQS